MIDIKHPNGYRGVLQNGVLTVYYGKDKIMCLNRDYKSEIEIYRQLEEIPRYVEMVRVIRD